MMVPALVFKHRMCQLREKLWGSRSYPGALSWASSARSSPASVDVQDSFYTDKYTSMTRLWSHTTMPCCVSTAPASPTRVLLLGPKTPADDGGDVLSEVGLHHLWQDQRHGFHAR